MAKAAKANETTKTVPAAEPVGGPLPVVQNDATSTNTSPATVTNDGTGNPAGPVGDQSAAVPEIEVDEALPHLAAAVVRHIEKHGRERTPNGIRVTAKVDGLRRGGLRHIGTTEHPINKFEHYQLNQIFGDPDLIAELIELDD